MREDCTAYISVLPCLVPAWNEWTAGKDAG